jgi:GRAM domain
MLIVLALTTLAGIRLGALIGNKWVSFAFVCCGCVVCVGIMVTMNTLDRSLKRRTNVSPKLLLPDENIGLCGVCFRLVPRPDLVHRTKMARLLLLMTPIGKLVWLIIQCDDVRTVNSESVYGRLYLTNYRVIFYGMEGSQTSYSMSLKELTSCSRFSRLFGLREYLVLNTGNGPDYFVVKGARMWVESIARLAGFGREESD